MTARTIQLYGEYAEHGHRGEPEVTTSYSITLEGSARATIVSLEIEEDRRSFPSNGDAERTVLGRFSIEATKLVEFIEHEGKRC